MIYSFLPYNHYSAVTNITIFYQNLDHTFLDVKNFQQIAHNTRKYPFFITDSERNNAKTSIKYIIYILYLYKYNRLPL